MKKLKLLALTSLLLISCTSKSQLPDDSILTCHHDTLKKFLAMSYQIGDFYIYKGNIVKENNRYYFVDSNFKFHCSVFEDTRIYNNDDYSTYKTNYDGIELNKECYIWVSYYITYSGDHATHKEDRLMCLDVSKFMLSDEYDSTDYQSVGFYDHVLNIYYDCSKDKISDNCFDISCQQFPILEKYREE